MSRTTIPVAPQVTTEAGPAEKNAHVKAWRRQPDFPDDATIELVSGTNPWRHNSLGWPLFENVLRPHPKSTIGEIIELAKPHGFGRSDTMQHLRWLFTWGGSYIKIGGQLYSPPPVGAVVAERPKRKTKARATA